MQCSNFKVDLHYLNEDNTFAFCHCCLVYAINGLLWLVMRILITAVETRVELLAFCFHVILIDGSLLK